MGTDRVTDLSRIRGTTRTQQGTRGHGCERNRIEEDPGGNGGTLEDTPGEVLEISTIRPASTRSTPLVVVESGAIELEAMNGLRRTFVKGDVTTLARTPLRVLRNRNPVTAVLSATTRFKRRPYVS